MNKFVLYPCIKPEEENPLFDGHVVCLGSNRDLNLKVYFPIREDYAQLINNILKGDNQEIIKHEVISVFTTMIDSWGSGDRFLSGAILDLKTNSNGDPEMSVQILISYMNGILDSVVRTSFSNSMILAAMEDVPVFMTDALMENLLPKGDDFFNDDDDGDDDGGDIDGNKPVDKEILEIAKNIISGNIKD